MRFALALWGGVGICVAAIECNVAQAETYTIQKVGAWTAYGGTDVQGVRTCGLINKGADRALAIRSWVNSRFLTVQVTKNSWSIPAGAKVAIELQFDDYSPWSSNEGAAVPPSSVQFRIHESGTEKFLRQFGAANKVTVNFPSGNEAAWSGGLTGTAVLTTTFLDCILKMRGGATQPYSTSPSQPHGAERTQPFGGTQSQTQPSSAPSLRY